MDQRERRARDIFLSRGFKCGRNSFNQSSFAGTKIAAQENEPGWNERAGKGAAESDGLLGRMSRDLL